MVKTFGSNRRTVVLLLCGFSLIITLMVAIAHQGLSQLEQSKSRLDNSILVHSEKAALIGQMQQANRERVINLQYMLITDDFFELDEAAQNNMRMANLFIKARRKLEELPNTPGETALLEDLRRFASEAAPMNDYVRDMLWNEEDNAAERGKEALMNKVIPAQNRIFEVFDELVTLYSTANGEAIRNSNQEYDFSRTFIVHMLQLAVFLAIVTGFCVTRFIVLNERALQTHRDELEVEVSHRTRALELTSSEAVMARREAEQANKAKSTFMANMSHELRTPLNAVLGFSEVMDLQVLGPLSKKYREYAQHIHGSAQHLLQLIEQLLDLSRIEAGRLELDEFEVCFSAILDETLMVVRSAFQRETYEIYLTPDSARILVRGDERLLKQTLINIVSNAAKYSSPGDPVELRLCIIDENAVLTIRDEGIGIAPEEIPRLFNPYERSEAQTARAHQGTGLGLAIARSLIEAHGGTLAIQSTLDVGTLVTITLPAERILKVGGTQMRHAVSA